jgi:MFS transporter, DHA3 family, macrolide efflux protein
MLCIFRAVASSTATSRNSNPETISLRVLYGDFGQNFKTSLRKPELFVTISYSAVCILLVGAALRILIPAMLEGAGYADVIIGGAMSLIALGALVGAVMCGKTMLNFNTRNLMFCWSLYGIALAILPACVFNVVLMTLGCLALGALGAFVDVILPTNIQRLSTDVNLGKNFSLFSTLANTGEALSGGLAGALVVVASAGTSLTVIGVLIASIAYIGKIKTVPRRA